MATTSDDLDITVLIPTYNRAEILRETLEAMCQVKRDGLKVEFVVIDNNSSDHTKEVVESFADRLPLCYLFEPRPGKNCALNRALDTVELGRIVVFTDDDVTPQPDWLSQTMASSERNADYLVGGGKIINIWPNGEEPEYLAFAAGGMGINNLDLGPEEMLFSSSGFPWGANLWVSRQVFDDGLRYDQSIGPSPTKRAMGSEASFLLQLADKGHRMVYCPHSVVFHRAQQVLFTARGIRRRAYTYGRGQARLHGFAQVELRRRYRRLW